MTITPMSPTASVAEAAFIACIPHMRAFAKILTGDDARADDLVEAAIRRARNVPAPALHAGGLKRWMFTMLHVLHYGRPCGTDADAPPESDAPAMRHTAVSDEFADAFWQLRDDQREVLILQAAAGLSRDDAAAVHGGPRGTVDLRAARARHDLQTLLQAAAGTRGMAPTDARQHARGLTAANLA
jgi:RNA polymerase sigma-70 factor (ECF subfamily)